MNDKYLQDLYNWISIKDPSYSNRYSLKNFSDGMKGEEYASEMYNWITTKDPTFSKRYNLPTFLRNTKKTLSGLAGGNLPAGSAEAEAIDEAAKYSGVYETSLEKEDPIKIENEKTNENTQENLEEVTTPISDGWRSDLTRKPEASFSMTQDNSWQDKKTLYRIRDDKWEMLSPWNKSWESIDKKTSKETNNVIEELNKTYNKSVSKVADDNKGFGLTDSKLKSNFSSSADDKDYLSTSNKFFDDYGEVDVPNAKLIDPYLSVNSFLLSKTEEEAQVFLMNNFKKYGFEFSQEGLGTDRIRVTSKNGAEPMVFMFDGDTEEERSNEAIRLQSYLRNNSSFENENNIDSENSIRKNINKCLFINGIIPNLNENLFYSNIC